MPLAGFDSPIPASDLPQTYALDRAATGTGILKLYVEEIRLDEKKYGNLRFSSIRRKRFVEISNSLLDQKKDFVIIQDGILTQCTIFYLCVK
jgi:hypothetical protein